MLSPMAGISDLPFRRLNRKFGCSFAFVEMINARSLGHKSKKTQSMLSTNAQDKPLGVQLLGCEPNFIERAMDGCSFAFVEMINARSLGHKSKKTQSMLSTNQKDKPLGVQLLGCEPNFIERAMDILQKYEFDLLDFNSACPAN